MSLLLSDVIAGVRSRNPAFERHLVPDKSLADFFTTEQQRLMTRGLERDRQYLAQSLTVALELSSSDAPGTAGDATAGGVPAELSASGAITVSEETAGSLVTVETDGVGTLVNDTDVVSATATTLVGLAAAWVVNAYIGKAVVITAGKGYGQPPRTIVSNTANQLTWTDAWSVVPDSTSTFKIVSEILSLTRLRASSPQFRLSRSHRLSRSAQRQRRSVHRLHEAAHGLGREGCPASELSQHPGRQCPLQRFRQLGRSTQAPELHRSPEPERLAGSLRVQPDALPVRWSS
jgi:hypothetical protein